MTMPERTADHIAIERLYFDYAWGIDHPDGIDGDGVGACFTPEGRWEASPAGIVCVGPAAISEHMRTLPYTSPMHHYITNIRVDLAADGLGASTTAYVLFWGQLPLAPGESVQRGVTRVHRYDNSCVKVGRSWLFSSLVVAFQYGDVPTP